MATNFPAAIDTTATLPNPSGTSNNLNDSGAYAHDYQHDTVNDAVRAIEAKVGVTASADTTSLDYQSRFLPALVSDGMLPSPSLVYDSTGDITTVASHEFAAYSHRLEKWVYASTAARTSAVGFVSTDIGKLAFQSTDNTYWRLVNTTPSWAQVFI